MVTDVLLHEPVPVMAADHRIGQVQIFDDSLQLATVLLGDLAAENDGDLVRLPNGTIGVQQPVSHPIERRAAAEDQIIAVLDLSEKQAVLTAGVFAFPLGEERRESGEPLLAAGQQIAGRQGIREFLQSRRIGATEERIGALLEINAFGAHAQGQPVVLVQANARREGQVRAHAHKHRPPALVVDIEVVLHDPALRDLEMPAVVLFVANGDHDAGGFAGLDDGHHLIGFGVAEIGFEDSSRRLSGASRMGAAHF